MTHNDLYPGFVKLFYANGTHQHHQILPVLPDSHGPGEEPTFLINPPGSDVIAMNTAVDAYIAVADNLFNATTNFQFAEFWNIPTPGGDPVFEYIYEIGAPGVAASANIVAAQAVLSFRTSLGGILKLYFMESALVIGNPDPFPFSNATMAALAAYFCSLSTGWVVGRDGGKPLSGLRATTKINDALRKKYIMNT